MVRILYDILAEPVPVPSQQGEAVTESRWHQPWSDPLSIVFKLFYDGRRIAQAAGAFTPVLTAAQEPEAITESRWHQPWSEPVRFKPTLLAGDQPFFFIEPDPLPFYKAYARAYVIT
jgi:hypothetical protein